MVGMYDCYGDVGVAEWKRHTTVNVVVVELNAVFVAVIGDLMAIAMVVLSYGRDLCFL